MTWTDMDTGFVFGLLASCVIRLCIDVAWALWKGQIQWR
jgi:hypothetical protein